MRIQIKEFTKRGIINRLINRSSLSSLISFDKIKNKTIWIKQELYQQLVAKAQKKAIPKTYKKEKGTTELIGKKYIRFRFALWRYELSEVERIKILFEKLRKKYKLVKTQGKKFPTQRIGITIASQSKEYDTFTNARTKRKNTRELYDFISTATYANNDPSTEGMFEELFDKVLKYFYKTGKSPSLLDEETIKTAKHFFVFFVEA
jgi:hypothetical protein